MLYTLVILALGRWRQEDDKLKATLACTMKPYLKQTNKRSYVITAWVFLELFAYELQIL